MPLTQNQIFFRTDDFLKDTILKPLVDMEDITSWQKNHIKAVQTSKEKKKVEKLIKKQTQI